MTTRIIYPATTASNDHKGAVVFDTETGADSFYASGQSGTEVRADGNGGKLPRGYYARCKVRRVVIGPFSSRTKAVMAFARRDHDNAESDIPATAGNLKDGAPSIANGHKGQAFVVVRDSKGPQGDTLYLNVGHAGAYWTADASDATRFPTWRKARNQAEKHHGFTSPARLHEPKAAPVIPEGFEPSEKAESLKAIADRAAARLGIDSTIANRVAAAHAIADRFREDLDSTRMVESFERIGYTLHGSIDFSKGKPGAIKLFDNVRESFLYV